MALPDGRYLFMIYASGSGYNAFSYIGSVMGARASPEVESWALDRERLPMMVRFGDPADSQTVEEVDPGNLPRSFGGATRLRRVYAQEVRERVTRGRIDEVLPWLDRDESSIHLDGKGAMTSRELRSILQHHDFIGQR